MRLKKMAAALLMVMLVATVFSSETEAAETNIASGVIDETYGQITWVIDSEGNLTVTGTGDVSDSTEYNRAPWYEYHESILSADIDVTGMTDASYLFYECRDMKTLDVSGLDTSKIENMCFMFNSCEALTELDVSHFVTDNVTDMCGMFGFCKALTELDVTNFNTENVTRFDMMFEQCIGLTELDITGLDTGNAVNMNGMFYGCSGLTSLDLTNFDTANATDLGNLFTYCSGLTELNLTNIDTTNATDISYMFANCSGLASLDVSGFVTDNATNMAGIFSGCSGLTTLDVSALNTSNAENIGSMFGGCSGLTQLDVSGFDTTNVTSMTGMFNGCSGLTELDLSNFDTDNLKEIGAMFNGCSGLKTLDLSHFNTSKVTSMYNVFRDCSSLESVNLSGWDSSQVTWMHSMFYGCSSLKTVDLSGFDMTNVTVGFGMFDNCYNLTSIETPLNCTQSVNLPIQNSSITWTKPDGTTVTTLPTGLTESITLTRQKQILVSGEVDEEYGHITWEIDMSGNLFVEGTGNITDLGEDQIMPWADSCEAITSAEINVTGMTNAAFLFNGCTNLRQVNFDGFDTSTVTSMSGMFAGCSNLSGLDFSSFDTSAVTSMYIMFAGCSMYELDLSGFNTENVQVMAGMFSDCVNLSTLDLTGFDTADVIAMDGMFYECANLETLDLSGFDMSSLQSAAEMFTNCDNLKTLNTPLNCAVEITLPIKSTVESWEQPDGTKITALPQNTAESTTLTRDWVYAGNIVDEEYGQIYWNIDENGKLYVEGTGDWRDPYAIYDVSLEDRVAPWYESREEIISAEINTTNTVSTAFMFYGCSNLQTVDFTNFDTSALTMMDHTFDGCNSLEELDLTNFNTSQVTDMDCMFRECWSLTELDLSHFDTANVQSMAEMFASCGLRVIDLSSFDMSNVEYAYDMLYNSVDAIKIYTPKNCSLEINLPVGGDTSEDWYMEDGTQVYTLPMDLEESIVLFEDICGAGTIDEEYGQITWTLSEEGHLTVEGIGDYHLPFNVEGEFEDMLPPWYANRENIFTAEINVTGMTDASYMFMDCVNLEEVDLTNFETENLVWTASMFCYCENLVELDVSGFNTSNVENMYGMFAGCSSLTSLDVSGFDTGKVTDMGEMFPGCTSLTSLDVSGFDTSNVEYMDYMFTMCSGLTELDVSGFNTANVISMNSMFGGCVGLTELDLSSFDMSKVEDAQDMLTECTSLESVKAPLKCALEVALPTVAEDDQWYQPDGTVITAFPQGLTESIPLQKNAVPEVAPPEEEPTTPVTEVFSDVAAGEWYVDSVQYVYDKGIMSGNNGVFNPTGSLTRAQIVSTLYRIAGSPEVTDYSACTELVDVPRGEWYTDAVCWAYSTGVGTGNSTTKMFNVNSPVTRQQLASFFYRLAQYKEFDTTVTSDLSGLLNTDKVESYAEDAIRWAVGIGIISGSRIVDTNGNTVYDLNPAGTATRAQMSTILQRFCEYYNI